ncbi:hypothetical protein GF373_00570 [bacterium]|nr:hypothetical protein [bacterium]
MFEIKVNEKHKNIEEHNIQQDTPQAANPSPPVEEVQEGQATRLPVNLPVFSGPLDLLVHLISKKELDIFSVSLDNLTEEYLNTIHEAESQDLDIAGEYLVLAATLIRYKARALLPKEEVETEDEEISDQLLEMRRQEYERFRALADELRTREEKSASIFPRQGKTAERTQEVVEYDEVSIYDLYHTFQKIIDEIGSRPPDSVEGESYSVDEKMLEIEGLLFLNERIILTDYLSSLSSKMEIIVVFLALLEMIRLQEIHARQERNHAEIVLEKGENYKKSDSTDEETDGENDSTIEES